MPAADKTASQLTAAAVMTPAPRTCSALSSVLEVVLIHRDADRGAVPVVEAGEPVRIVTDRDAALALAEHYELAALGVGDILTKGVVSVAPDDSLASVAAKVGDRGLHRLRVVDSGTILQGIISWSDLAPHSPDHASGRLVPEVVEPPRERAFSMQISPM